MADGSLFLMSSQSVESFSLMLLGLVFILFAVGVWTALKEERRLPRRTQPREEEYKEKAA